jgi:uncharacterized surface anchored protein
VFTLFKDNAPLNGAAPHGAEDTATTLKCTTGAPAGTPAGTCQIKDVPFGQYWVVETTTPAGYDTAADQNVILGTGNTPLTLNFTDPRQRGAILVTKLRKHAADGTGDHPHAGVTFTLNGVDKVTDANCEACFDGLLFGTYSVHETTPTGYHGEADKNVTVDNKASCGATPYVGETVTFHNTPLTDITVSVNSQIDGGTASTMVCKNAANTTVASGSTGANGDGSTTALNLPSGMFTCTVDIDP